MIKGKELNTKHLNAKELIGQEYDKYRVIGIEKITYPGGGGRNMLRVVCSCGHSQLIQRSRWNRGAIICGCSDVNSKTNWDENNEIMILEQLEKIDALKAKKRERELNKLKGNVTSKRSQKMVISI